MILKLTALPDLPFGIYRRKTGADRLPARMRYLHPELVQPFLSIYEALKQRFFISDMLRSAEASLQAVKEKRGAQPPGFSGHNYGFSIDVSLTANKVRGHRGTLTENGMSKKQLDELMEAHGFYCHRLDHNLAFEAWHYNGFTGREFSQYYKSGDTRTSAALERKIQYIYGSSFLIDGFTAQNHLASMGLYRGEIDGIIGPLTCTAVNAFQRAFSLPETSCLDARTKRTLAFVNCRVPSPIPDCGLPVNESSHLTTKAKK